MTTKEWYSCESVWPVIRRMLVAILIGIAVHEVLARFDLYQPSWFLCIGLPVFLSMANFTAYLCHKKDADSQQEEPEV